MLRAPPEAQRNAPHLPTPPQDVTAELSSKKNGVVTIFASGRWAHIEWGDETIYKQIADVCTKGVRSVALIPDEYNSLITEKRFTNGPTTSLFAFGFTTTHSMSGLVAHICLD